MQVGEIPTSKFAYKKSLAIAIPAVIEMVSISLMDMVDTFMVGRVSASAMAAVGLTAQPRMLVFSIFMALNIAITAIIARKKGAGEMDEAKSCLRHGLLLGVLLSLKLTAVAVIFARPLMNLACADYDIIDYATSYFRITSFVLIFQALTSTICVAQRAIGNTKITMVVNVTAKIVSVVLNFLLIEGRFFFPRLEVDGVAYARSIAAIIAFTLALISVLRKDSPLRIRLNDYWGFKRSMTKSVGRLTANGMLEQVSLRFGFFMYASIVARLGTDELAAHVVAMQLMALSFTFADGIGAATTALVGQNLGQKRPDLSIMYGKLGMRLALVCAVVLSTLSILTRVQFATVFVPDYPHIIATASSLILILAFILPLQTSQLVMAGSLRGSGDNRYVALTMLIAVGFMRPFFGFVFAIVLGWGVTGAWYAIIFDQAARLIMLFTRFARGKWTKAKI